jgi:pterin-4a-carbinolamine dehydratase
LTFISYRRDDTAQIAQALYLQLKELFGSGQLFMDVNSIRVGEAWPERIETRLKAATVVLALIGPGWLTAADSNGRRRIDDPTDWVRNEILNALRAGLPIIPVVINHRKNLPDPAGFPDEIRGLSFDQAMVLHLDPAEWAADVLALNNLLRQYRLVGRASPVQHMPSARIMGMAALTEQELAEALETLPEWEEWVDSLALEYPRLRQVLRRTFEFADFPEAVRFMGFIAPRFEERKHHPRWDNEWNVVRIQLTTWDVGNKITALDVETAQMVEKAYREFKTGS